MDLPFALRLAYYFPTAVILTSQRKPVSRDVGAANKIGKDTPSSRFIYFLPFPNFFFTHYQAPS